VPAELSSSILAALTQLTHAAPLQDAEAGHLLAYLGTVPDPRAGRGRRHPLVAILAMAAAAVRTGARSVAAVAEWAADTPSRSGRRLAPAARRPTAPRRHRRPLSAGPWSAWTLRSWQG
jgi:DDE_Tnp_1-associated